MDESNTSIKELMFEFTWCDYLTPCPFRKDVFIGDYDCTICPKFISINIEKGINGSTIDYKRYADVGQGVVTCNCQ